ncbi:hypothetical protein PV05_11339 [Exophiala xenobiotica]|uniref:NAD-dependent epimerase/dehydratase domain-containing protein n=1 Tax=Exophiala xenobiotica TaxID=348802 RepID=A0A0D2E4K3_9EURO|nr:uncharacterized protein PV05_11339 [Exophiala xenobiotica]KIW49685.1 hypothetical protein PV05_11339 [Exophiala xenobiotica]
MVSQGYRRPSQPCQSTKILLLLPSWRRPANHALLNGTKNGLKHTNIKPRESTTSWSDSGPAADRTVSAHSEMSTLPPKARPVLITAVNGFISSNITSCFLSHGYTVIGTVRSLYQHAWLQRLFDTQYPGLFSLVEVADIGDDGALESIIRARAVVSVIITTSLLDTNQNTPEPYISKSVDIALASLRAASRCPAVQSVVVTSSAWAMATPHVNVREALTASDYNEEAIGLVYDDAVTDPTYRGFLIVMAANAKKGRAMWDFVRETKPSWRFNKLLVDTTFGNIVSATDQGFPSTASLVNGPEAARSASFSLTPQWFVDVEDVAMLHVAAATRLDISSERIFAYGRRFTWKAITGILQNCRPEAEWTTDINEDEGECLVECLTREAPKFFAPWDRPKAGQTWRRQSGIPYAIISLWSRIRRRYLFTNGKEKNAARGRFTSFGCLSRSVYAYILSGPLK